MEARPCRSDLIGCGSDLLNSSTTFLAHVSPIHGRLARKKSLCAIAIVSASLFHYDGVWRVPYPIRLAFPVLTALLLPLLLFHILALLSLSLLWCSVPLLPRNLLLRRFPPHPFSPSHSSVELSWFMFLRLPSYGAPTERHRVHIFVTMTCLILRAEIRGANTGERRSESGRESEMMRECYEEEREKRDVRATKSRKRWYSGREEDEGGGVGMRDGRCRGTRQGRDSQMVRNRFQDRCSLRSPRWVENELQYARLPAEDSWVLVTAVRGEAAR